MTPGQKSQRAKVLAAALGCDLVGITSAEPPRNAGYYRQWLAAGHAGEMAYLNRNVELRSDPQKLLPGARSIICAAVNYRRPDDATDTHSTASDAPTGRISQYARGRDYHRVVRDILRRLVAALRAELPEAFDARICVDTAPVLEKELAARAGIGWIGKNTLLTHPRLGSFLFLGEVLTTLELEPDAPDTDHCGTCTRCIDACPTHAFTAPYQLNASRCIAYLTVEHRSEIPAEFHGGMGEWVYGCDICQDVCPFNRKSPAATNAALLKERLPARVPLRMLAEMNDDQYRAFTHGTAATRATRAMWQRNAAVAAENSGR